MCVLKYKRDVSVYLNLIRSWQCNLLFYIEMEPKIYNTTLSPNLTHIQVDSRNIFNLICRLYIIANKAHMPKNTAQELIG